MKKLFLFFIFLFLFGHSLMSMPLSENTDVDSSINVQDPPTSFLLNKEAASRNFGFESQTNMFQTNNAIGDFFNSLDIGFVIANTIKIDQHKNNVFYKKPIPTSNPYIDNYYIVSNLTHFEMTTPIINILYETSLPIWSTFKSTPRFTRFHFNFLGLANNNVESLTRAMIAPHFTHSTMSTRDYTQKTWDIKALFLFDYRISNELFLIEDGNPQRLKTRRFYYLGMMSYLEMMREFSRTLQIKAMRSGDNFDGIGLDTFPVLPYFDLYSTTFIYEEQIYGQWYEIERHKSPFNIEFGIFYVHEYYFPKHNLLVQPFFKWLLWSNRYVKTGESNYSTTLIKESGIEASISIQYVF